MAESRFVTYLESSFEEEKALIDFLRGMGRTTRQRWQREALLQSFKQNGDVSAEPPSKSLPTPIKEPFSVHSAESSQKSEPVKTNEGQKPLQNVKRNKRLLDAHLATGQ